MIVHGGGLAVRRARSRDVDAFTLSTARLVSRAKLDPDRAWRLIILANACNLAFKAETVTLLGSRRMAAMAGSLFAIAIVRHSVAAVPG